MKKSYNFSTISYKLFVEEHIGITDIGKNPEYEQELQDISERYIRSLFFNTDDTYLLKQELMTVLSKFKPKTLSPYLKKYYI